MSQIQYKYEQNPIQIRAKLNKNAIKKANMSKIQCIYEEDSGKESNQWIACWATTFAIPHYFYAMRQHLTLLQQSRYQHCAKNHNIWVPCCPLKNQNRFDEVLKKAPVHRTIRRLWTLWKLLEKFGETAELRRMAIEGREMW